MRPFRESSDVLNEPEGLRRRMAEDGYLYLRDLLATYPRALVAPLALTRLVESYRAIGYSEEVTETCGYFRTNHPNAPDLERVCPLTTPTPTPGA